MFIASQEQYRRGQLVQKEQKALILIFFAR